MRHKSRSFAWLTFALVVASSSASAVEIPFDTASDLSTGAAANAARLADLDGDGDLDAVYTRAATGTFIQLNTNGLGSFGTATNIGAAAGYHGVALGDVDGDGRIDVLVATGSADQVLWYRNLGSGSFDSSRTIATGLSETESLATADFDRDGDLDVVAASSTLGDVIWYRNDGTPLDGGWTSHNIDTTLTLPYDLTVGDVNRDGRPDVVVGDRTADAVYWHENDGTPETGTWTRRTVSSTANGVRSVRTGDVDGDGHLDVVFGDFEGADTRWSRNDGTPANGGWTDYVIRDNSSTSQFTTSVFPVDLDRDGDLDVVAGTDRDGAGTRLFFYENDGSPTAVPWTFYEPAQYGGGNGGFSSVAGDIDGDGDLDLLYSVVDNGIVAWVRNLTIHRSAAFGASTTIDAAADIPNWVSAADLDRDGDQDALIINVGTTGGIRWRANTNGNFGPASLIASANHARVIRVGDLDRDGDPDVVTAATHSSPGVAWHENTAGDASAWTTRTISSSFPSPYAADVGDVDGDGDPDVIATSIPVSGTPAIAWFENTAGNGSAWTQRAVANTQGYSTDVRLADVDGDGDLDAFYEDINYALIGWKENTAGNGSAWSDHEIDGGVTTVVPNAVEPADMDGDGDVDVVVASRGSNNSAWFENANGAGTSWTPHSLGSSAKLYWLRASDLDHDGDPDVVGSGEETDRLHVFENVSGDGASWDETWTPEWLDQPLGLDAVDLDGDGADDLLAVGFASENVIWLENRGGQLALPTTPKDYQGMVDGRRLDVLTIDLTHRGRAGDSDEWFIRIEPRLEDGLGGALDAGQAAALFEEIRIYEDTGSGAFELGSDTSLVVRVPPYSLINGVITFAFSPFIELSPGEIRRLFVVPKLAAAASSAGTAQFQIVRRNPAPDTALDGGNSAIELSIELPVDVPSGVIQALPASGDSDADGLSNVAEADTHGSDPLDVDTDSDELEDGDEVNTHGTSPIDDDSEDDGLRDGAELNAYGTNPLDWDSEDDGYCDGPFPILGCAAGDNCPAISNAGQTNSDAFAAGDVCQCGNVNGSGGITSADYQLARAAVVKPTGPPFDADFCDVNGDAACDVEDLAVLQRIVNAQPATLLDSCPGYRGQ